MESVISASTVVLVIRTRMPFYRSRPGTGLLISTALVAGATLALPAMPLGSLLGFEPLPSSFLLGLGAILVAYVAAAEAAKRWFFRQVTGRSGDRPRRHLRTPRPPSSARR